MQSGPFFNISPDLKASRPTAEEAWAEIIRLYFTPRKEQQLTALEAFNFATFGTPDPRYGLGWHKKDDEGRAYYQPTCEEVFIAERFRNAAQPKPERYINPNSSNNSWVEIAAGRMTRQGLEI